MHLNDQKNSVPDEQFGAQQLNSENTGNDKVNGKKKKKSLKDPVDQTYVTRESPEELPIAEESSVNKGGDDAIIHPESGTEEKILSEKHTSEEISENSSETLNKEQEVTVPDSNDDVKNENLQSTRDEKIKTEKKSKKQKKKTEEDIEKSEEEQPAGTEVSETEEKEEKSNKIKDKKSPAADSSSEPEPSSSNYALLSKSDLLSILEELLSDRNVSDIKNDVEIIKIQFYKKHKQEIEEKRKKFIAEGGIPEDFKPFEDPEELRLREILKKYRDIRLENTRYIEEEKQENLKKKFQVIEEIKELINSQESINKTFQDFRELQNRWREIGVVPQGSLNDLWETYHHYVEKFYDYININKELRDLDLRKNLEEKILLCEKAEALILEPNIINAFNTLQVYHEAWREIGPVPVDKRSEIWERFKEATTKVNKKYQQYFQDIKEQQKKNLEQKTLLCEKVEKLLETECENHKEWVRITNEILGIQKLWKTIGFAPRKENNKIYSRFRSACDSFFEKKRDFYAQNLEEQIENLQKKLDLCIQAESLMESTDWKISTEEMIKLQRKWKEIGPVPRKNSEAIWKRFRGACDKFFTRKSAYFKQIDSTYEANLKRKEELINEISGFILSDDVKKNLSTLQEFQRRWTEIGFVPLDKKEEIQQRYRNALNKHFDNLEVDELQKNVLKFGSRIENIMRKPHSNQKIRFEREKYMNKLQQLKSDISVWENNIGFFANNVNSEEMKKDFERKIESARQKIKLLEEKINLIDELDLEDQ